MANARRERRSLHRYAEFHFRVDTARHLVRTGLGEGDFELAPRLLQTSVERDTLARYCDVVGGTVVIEEYHYLTLGHAEVLDAELQTLLRDGDRRSRAYPVRQQGHH